MTLRIALLGAVFAVACADRPKHAELPSREAIEVLRIGAIDGPEALTSIGHSAVAISSQGWLFVSQPQDGVVKVFDQAGKYLHSIGRRGAGPGEFASPGGLGIIRDTLWVSDNVTGRVTYFNTAGIVIRTVSLPPTNIGTLQVRGGFPLRTGEYLGVSFALPSTGDLTQPVPITKRGINGNLLTRLQLSAGQRRVCCNSATAPPVSESLTCPSMMARVFPRCPPAEDLSSQRSLQTGMLTGFSPSMPRAIPRSL